MQKSIGDMSSVLVEPIIVIVWSSGVIAQQQRNQYNHQKCFLNHHINGHD
jgi:hypothetical protein